MLRIDAEERERRDFSSAQSARLIPFPTNVGLKRPLIIIPIRYLCIFAVVETAKRLLMSCE